MRILLTDTFNCSQERAFKAPILGDATQFLDGYFLQPAVVRFEEDSNWGQPNGIRYPVTNGNLLLKSGRIFTDETLIRDEYKRWEWQIYDFGPKSLRFLHKAVGEWTVTALEEHSMKVTYSYTFYPKNIFTRIITWGFIQIQWRGMMKRALKGIKVQAQSNCAFIYP